MTTLRLPAVPAGEHNRARQTIRLGSGPAPRALAQTLVLRRPVRPEVSIAPACGEWDEPADWTHMLGARGSKTWRALAVVAADAQVPTLLVANMLAAAGRNRGETIGVADLRSTAPGETLLNVLAYHVGRGERVVFASPPPAQTLARRIIAVVDEVLLVVTLGETTTRAVKDAVDRIDHGRLAGCVVLRRGSV
jgi:hypothetical protein